MTPLSVNALADLLFNHCGQGMGNACINQRGESSLTSTFATEANWLDGCNRPCFKHSNTVLVLVPLAY